MTNDPSSFTVWRGPSPADSFLLLPNDFARGKLPVPLRALDRVLLTHLLSLPPGWQGARQQLDESVLEGRDAVKRALSRLEVAGYLLRTKTRTPAGSWMWHYAVTIDPVEHPLAPSPENQSMAATSGNTEEPQVSPSTENPALGNQAIKEDGPKKTEFQKTESTSSGGAHAMERSELRSRQQPSSKRFSRYGQLEGKHLVGKPLPHVVQRLTALWSKAVVEHGGELPVDAEFSGNGSPVARPQHPLGHQLKAIVERHDADDITADWLDNVIGQVRAHAARTAELQRETAVA